MGKDKSSKIKEIYEEPKQKKEGHARLREEETGVRKEDGTKSKKMENEKKDDQKREIDKIGEYCNQAKCKCCILD